MSTNPGLAVTPPPAEPYTDFEQAHLDRIAGRENPLGWRLAGRDAAGHLVFTAEIDGGRRGDRRRCAQILTPAGLIAIG